MRSDRSSPPRGNDSNILHRRNFVAGSLAAGAGVAAATTAWKAWSQVTPMPTIPVECVPPVPFGQGGAFAASGGPVRVRKSVFELDANEVSRLKAAYAELIKITKDNDPRGWYRQGAVHCWYCSGAVNALNGMEIHGGWWFLAWHRAYLYFHETILGSLIGDPTFALPYWDWDSCHDDPKDMTGRNRFPGEVYGFPTDDPNIPNSLFDSTRAVGKDDRIPTSQVGPTVMKGILGGKSFTDFGGSGNEELPVFGPGGGAPQQAGSLEAGPHGLVHLWTTDPKNFSGLADMGMLAAAAFDPVFFAHHANIDRLWSVWAGMTGHANPSNDRWLNQQPFYFYDKAQTWVGIVINQVLDSEKSLSYRYEPPHWPPSAVAAAAPPPSGPMRVAQVQPLSAPITALDNGGQPKALPPQPTTLQLAMPAEAKQKINTITAAASPPSLVLRIDGVELPADRGVVVQVFVNRPDVTTPTQGPEPGYVGSIVIMPSTPARTVGPRTKITRNFGFPLSAEQASTLTGKDNLSVTLVPVTGANKPGEVLQYRHVYLSSR